MEAERSVGAGICDVCGRWLDHVGYARCPRHSPAKPLAWRTTMRVVVGFEQDIDELALDTEAQRK